MSYKDKAWCYQADYCKKNKKCERRLTEEHRSNAEKCGELILWSTFDCFKGKKIDNERKK